MMLSHDPRKIPGVVGLGEREKLILQPSSEHCSRAQNHEYALQLLNGSKPQTRTVRGPSQIDETKGGTC